MRIDEKRDWMAHSIDTPIPSQLYISENNTPISSVSPASSKAHSPQQFRAEDDGCLAKISDFSPEWDYTAGGAKMLVTGTDS